MIVTLVRPEAASRRRRVSRAARGFTLVELLIAIALTVILIGTLVFIFQGSSDIIVRTQRRIEAFQNVRRLIDLMEEDIGNAVKTVDMEFFADNPAGASPGHFDGGEELPELRQGQDPLGDVSGITQLPYYPSPVFVENTYVDPRTSAVRRSDMIYLRTLTSINGQARPALIRYSLGDTANRLPTMRRLVFFQNLGANPGDPPTTVREPAADVGAGIGDIVADGIIEFETKVFFKENNVSGFGNYLDPSEVFNVASFRPGDLPPDLSGAPNTPPTTLQPAFTGTGVLEERANGDVVFFADNGSQFPQVRLGDLVFLTFTGVAAPVIPPRNYRIQSLVSELPDRSLPSNFNDPNVRTTMRFEEPIDFTAVTAVPDNDIVVAGFPQHRVTFRVGWMPSSIQARFRIRDLQAREEYDIVRVFKILTS